MTQPDSKMEKALKRLPCQQLFTLTLHFFSLSGMVYIGIDCAKLTFEVALPGEKNYQIVKFNNTEEGFTSLVSRLSPGSHCVMEATGP